MSQCGKPAVAVYVWPTMTRIVVCETCAERARGIASAMGFRLGVLEAEPDAVCDQQVRPSATR
jgi:hypothetical protein